MPIYEYRCQKCGKGFEHLARTLNEAAPPCPACGATQPDRQFSTFHASVAAGKRASCSMGACDTPTCAGGTCPFG